MKKIVLTGAPSSGKSSVMKELKSLYKDEALLIPEGAVILLGGGFPAPSHGDLEQISYFQQAILDVQAGLEFILPKQNPKAKFAVFDRGSLDGAGFWPPGPEDFLKKYGVDRKKEYAKFTDVLFLELPTPEMYGGMSELRFHNYEQSLASQKHLENVWKDHPRFQKIAATVTAEEKIQAVIQKIKSLTV
jgi:hypothetical protein